MAKELVLTTEKTGQQHNVLMTDLHTGTTIRMFKDGSSLQHGLCIMKDEYILSAVNSKPLIYYWAVESKDKAKGKLIVPGLVTALAVSNDGNFIIAAIAENIHIWQTHSGDHLCLLKQHYQSVRTIKFTDDDSYFITAGDDNLIIVWELDKVIMKNPKESSVSVIEPKYVLTGHSLPITDLHCGSGGPGARVASVSMDCTCKIWDLLTGRCMATLVKRYPLTSVTMDTAEMYLFLGCRTGQIQKINIHEKPMHALDNSDRNADILIGHNQSITCLQVSLDGSLLVSGSNDCNVMVWDISSGQCIRTIGHKGPITNILVTMTPKTMLCPAQYLTPIPQLKKNLYSNDEGSIIIGGTEEEEFQVEELTTEELRQYTEGVREPENKHIEEMQTIQGDLMKMTEVCQNLYEYYVMETAGQN